MTQSLRSIDGSTSHIGSDFHWIPRDSGQTFSLPHSHVLFGMARDAIAAVVHATAGDIPRLWIPNYFCHQTKEKLKKSRIELLEYKDNPRQSNPQWQTLQPRDKDFVLFANYFGIRKPKEIVDWQNDHPSVTVIEDHTHDPCSKWALESTADYAVSSLRKTIPIPDGAVLWAPIEKVLPEEPEGKSWTGSALKLASMIFKRDCLENAGQTDELFGYQRYLSQQGDELLDESTSNSISPWSREYLRYGISKDWRDQRAENVLNFIKLWNSIEENSSDISLLFQSWPANHCPFNPVLQFKSLKERNDCRAFLITHNIYAPIHWPDQEISVNDSTEKIFLLTIPLDARCNENDIKKIVAIFKTYFSSSPQ